MCENYYHHHATQKVCKFIEFLAPKCDRKQPKCAYLTLFLLAVTWSSYMRWFYPWPVGIGLSQLMFKSLFSCHVSMQTIGPYFKVWKHWFKNAISKKESLKLHNLMIAMLRTLYHYSKYMTFGACTIGFFARWILFMVVYMCSSLLQLAHESRDLYFKLRRESLLM